MRNVGSNKMETTEKIVEAYCRHIKRWFTISNIKCGGQYEIDILAVEFAQSGQPLIYHIESGVSISGGFSKLTAKPFSEKDLKTREKAASQRRTIGFFIQRKFGPEEVQSKIAEYGLNPARAKKIIVTWGWEADAKAIADKEGIILWHFPDLLKELAGACAEGKTYFTDDTLRTLQLFMRSGHIALTKNEE